MYFRASRGVSCLVGRAARNLREAAVSSRFSVCLPLEVSSFTFFRSPFLRFSFLSFSNFPLVQFLPIKKERAACVIHVREGDSRTVFLFFFLGSSWQSFVVLGVQQRRQAAAASNTRQRAGVRDTIQGNRAIRLFVVASIRVLRNARINVSVTVQDVKRGNTRQVSIFLVASAKR